MKKSLTIFKKQALDTFKNKTVFIQIVMFPIMAVIMTNSVSIDDMPHDFFVLLFASMYIGMAPLLSMSAIIAEEKEKGTLRVLLMSNVKPHEYLVGVGIYIWFVCMMGSVIFAAVGGYSGSRLVWFMSIMAVGILISILIGAVIGTWSRTQMMSTSISLPFMMVFSFIPMISMFNQTIKQIGRFAYSQQIYNLMNQTNGFEVTLESLIVFISTIISACILFVIAYRRSGLS